MFKPSVKQQHSTKRRIEQQRHAWVIEEDAPRDQLVLEEARRLERRRRFEKPEELVALKRAIRHNRRKRRKKGVL